MEGVEAEYGSVEWTIENFSCWNATIHHEVITSLNFFGELRFEIRPRGGNRGLMSVRMLGDPSTAVSGDLSLVASDGYVFCSAEVDIDSQRPAFELSSAPAFKNVVSRSKMNEGLHEDQITLRFQLKGAVSDSVLRMRTAICVHEFSIRISGEALYNISLYGLLDQCIRRIEYPIDDGATTAKIDLYAAVDELYPEAINFRIKQTGPQKTAYIRSRISVMDKDGTVVRGDASECLYSDNNYWTVSQILTRTGIKEKRTLWRLRIIPENKADLLCTYDTTDDLGRELPIGRPTSNLCMEKPSGITEADISNYQPENSVEVLTKELMCLYRDQKYSDITLKCDNVTFPAHRNILSARSPVLDRMLSDMKEVASGEVDIGDLDPSTLSRFLTYLYTGVVEDLQCDSTLKLYYAAEKYQVPSLKRDCSKFLCANVSISNVCDILSLAERHGDQQLTSAAHDIILSNFNQVLSSDEWGSLFKSDPVLFAKTISYLAQKKCVGNISAA